MQSNFTLSLLITLQIILIINYQVNPVEIHFFSKSKEDSYQNDNQMLSSLEKNYTCLSESGQRETK